MKHHLTKPYLLLLFPKLTHYVHLKGNLNILNQWDANINVDDDIIFSRYDQECVGLSTGVQLTIEFEHWLEDALAMVDRVCDGPVILVASSVGAWVIFYYAQAMPSINISMQNWWFSNS